jgi:hypothetical protein
MVLSKNMNWITTDFSNSSALQKVRDFTSLVKEIWKLHDVFNQERNQILNLNFI